MRGAAVILAAGAAWVIATGAVPHMGSSRGVRIRPRILALSATAFIAGSIVGLAATGISSVALAVGTLAIGVPLSMEASRRRVANTRRMEAWPHILAQVRSSLSSGSTLPDALATALEQAGDDFADMATTVRREVMFGVGFAAALDSIRTDQEDPTTDRVLVTLAAANSAGGSRVGHIVGVLARSVSDEVRVRAAHEAGLSEQRLTVKVALVAPWVLLGLSILTNPQADAAFSTTQGAIVVGIGLIATFTGWLLSVRTARLARAPRVFR